MGVIELIGLAVSAATTVSQMAQARKAARAQREAGAISSASQQIQDRVARRKAIREARVRQAMVTNMAAQSGAAGSSGEAGATSAIQSNLASGIANQTSQQLGAAGISAANQRAADAESSFNRIGAFGKMVGQGLDLWDEYNKPVGA